jgi:HlyD family secretion protein
MTARVDFLVKSAVNVLKVANAALRYKPSAELLTQLGAAPTPRDATTTAGSSRAAGTGAGSSGMRARRDQGTRSGNGNGFGTLYFLDPDGKLQVARVRTGISDGASTEIQGQRVTEGMKVIDGLASTTTAATQRPAANPLGGAQQSGGGRGRGGGGF